MYELVAMDNLGIYSCRMIWFVTTNKQRWDDVSIFCLQDKHEVKQVDVIVSRC